MMKKGICQTYVRLLHNALFFVGLCMSFNTLFAQQTVRLSGVVFDSTTQKVIPNVTVITEKGMQSTQTNKQGEFLLEVVLPVTLQFKSIGYETQTLAVSSFKALQIQLTPSSDNLEEVVVIGYGTQKKTSLTAAVSTMKGEEVSNVPVADLTNTLGGRLSGVVVKQGSGEPDRDGSQVFIRGVSTTGSSQPLIIIDGIPREFSQFSQLDPNVVESFTVLKDGAAVAPYGVAGANGVILVRTKSGKEGKPTLSYNSYLGFQNPTVLPDYVTNYRYALLLNEAAKNDGLPIPYSEEALQKFKDGSDPDVYPVEYVWDRLVNSDALLTTHNFEVSGGTEDVKYYGSLGYQYQEGMWKTTNKDRYNLSLNLEGQVSNTTQITLGVIGRVQKSAFPPSDYSENGTGRIFELAGFATPLFGPFQFSNGMYGNHVMSAIFGTGSNQNNTTTLNTQLTLKQDLPFLKGLYFKGTVAYDPSFLDHKTWRTPMHVASIDTTQTPYVITDGLFGDPKAALSISNQKKQQLTYQAGLYYSKDFGEHHVDMLGLFEAKNNFAQNSALSRMNYDLLIDEINLGSSNPQDWGTSGSSSEAKQMGLVYRISYDYKQKYMLEGTGRYDGHYYFAPGKRFGFFPAVSLGWRLSEESFLKDVSFLSNLKLRASYGEVGALAGGPFQYMGSYRVVGNNYKIEGNPVIGVSERVEPNPNITWERAKKTDIGLEIGLWNSLLNMEIDYFYEKRGNMLVSPNVVVPAEYGIGLSQINGGIMENRGVEFSVGSSYSINEDIQIALAGNFTYAKNKLIQVYETDATYNNPNRRQTGRSLGTQFGYESMGFFQVDDFDASGNLKSGIATQPWGKVEPGDIRYRDMNNDGKIDESDITKIGDPVTSPGILYGFTPSVRYKGLALELFFQGAGKVDYYYHPSSVMPFWNGMQAYNFNFDYWTPENTNASNPRLTSNPLTNNLQTSSFWINSAAYLRLKTITVSYDLPATILSKFRLKAVRVFASGQNLITWTDLKYDPELGSNTSWVTNSAWTYPQQKIVSLGLNVSF